MNDVPAKYIKKFSDVFTPVINDDYIIVPPLVFFRNVLKMLKSSLHIRRINIQEKLTTGRLVYFPIHTHFMKDFCMMILVIALMFYQNLTAVLKRFWCLKLSIYMIKTIRKIRDNHGVFAAVITNFSKTFNCISNELLIAKLHAYGFDKISLKAIISYLKNRTQITQVLK